MATRKTLLERAAKQLRPGGALLLGSAESTIGITDAFRREEASGSTFFRPAA